MADVALAVIGGTGVYDVEGLTELGQYLFDGDGAVAAPARGD